MGKSIFINTVIWISNIYLFLIFKNKKIKTIIYIYIYILNNGEMSLIILKNIK